MAVDRVEQLLRLVTETLEHAGIEYAIIGGNAVAAWVSKVDDGATRATKDVDILLRRPDLTRVADALRPVNLIPIEILGVHMFVDQQNPSPKTGAPVVIAGERIRAEYKHPAPDPRESETCDAGFRLLNLAPLVAMKLQAYRFIDRAHIQDMLAVGLIDDAVRNALPQDLRTRLDDVGQSEM